MKLNVLENLAKLDINSKKNVYVQSMLIDLSEESSSPSFSFTTYLRDIFRCGYELIVLLFLWIHASFILIISFLTKRNIAHYLIFVISKNKNITDHRSEEMVKVLNNEKYINFYHSASPLRYFINIYRLPFFSIYYKSLLPSSFLKILIKLAMPFLKNNVIKKYQLLGKIDIFIFNLVIRFLKPKVFVCMDDPRNTALIRFCSKSLNITTFGYMHGRFNEFHIGLCGNPFDYYFVWSNYFKNKYIQMTGQKLKTIFYLGDRLLPKQIKIKKNQDMTNLNILFVDDDLTPLDCLTPYINVISNSEGCKVFVRTKNKLDFHIKNVQADISSSFHESLMANEIDIVVGGISTCLIESSKYYCLPISIQNGIDYGSHLIKDSLCIPVYSEEEFKNFLDQLSGFDFNRIMNDIQSIHSHGKCIKLKDAWHQTIENLKYA